MRVSQRLDYALRGLTALAQRPPGTFAAAGEVADALGLPRRFLEQQFSELSRAGIVRCRRGAAGGCALARPPAEITAGDVVRAVQGSVLDVPRVTGSAVSEMWSTSASALERSLDEIDLASLAKRQKELDAAAVAMYYI